MILEAGVTFLQQPKKLFGEVGVSSEPELSQESVARTHSRGALSGCAVGGDKACAEAVEIPP